MGVCRGQASDARGGRFAKKPQFAKHGLGGACPRGFPQVSHAEARAAREKARALVKQGIPCAERRQVKQRNLEVLEERKRAKESSFAKVAQTYLAKMKPVFALSSHRTKESRTRKHLSPKFDGMPMGDIGVKHICPLLEECKAHGAGAAIHVTWRSFGHLRVRGGAWSGRAQSDSQPAWATARTVQREQIQKFYQELRGYRGYPETSLCLRLIALTACRPGEAADAEWEEFDFEDALWRRPATKMKARRDHVSPLSTQAICGLFLFWIGPLSVECHSLVICPCRVRSVGKWGNRLRVSG
ncbi:Prophage CP4-57 integrase [Bordetella hinzii]|nr:Prophage CP4-57 integrase [Bordetella hinzii]